MSALFYLCSILLANLLVHRLGIVHLWGLSFPAGAVVIGLTFSARDLVQERWGKFGCWGWMLVAAALTFAFNRQLALASLAAFMVAETSDWAIYSYTRGRIEKRLLLSNLVSTPLDSLVFVLLAFGPVWPAIWGQALVKLLGSLLVLPLFKDGKVRSFRLSPQQG